MVEAAFANALDVGVGDPVTLDGRSFEVVGVAVVTAAMPPYPGRLALSLLVARAVPLPRSYRSFLRACYRIQVWSGSPGRRCGAPHPRGSRLPVLRDEPEAGRPGGGPGVRRRNPPESLDAPRLASREEIVEEATELARDAQILLLIGAWLLGLLAVAVPRCWSAAEIADQDRRVDQQPAPHRAWSLPCCSRSMSSWPSSRPRPG